MLETRYRRASVDDIFTGVDLKANTTLSDNMRLKCGYYLCPILGCIAYGASHTELFVPAGHVGLLMDVLETLRQRT